MLRHATAVRAHRFSFFGREFCYGSLIDWQADPVTHKRWPRAFHAHIPVHGGDVGFGDVKYVWELNRQQFLIDLAKGHYLTGNHEDLRSLQHLVRNWIAGNPYGTGVNWACALEPAFRSWSWLWAYFLTAEALDDQFHLEWLEGLYDHGRFLAAHLERYSSPYNHLIGEAAALFALGLCFPEFRESDSWRRRGRAVLESRLRDQFYADGGSVEQSTFYHHATLGFYLLAALVGRANGHEVSSDVWAAIERGLDFSMQLTQPDGATPAIGGADDGKPIRLEHLPLWDFRPYLATGAVLFGRVDFKAVAGRFYEDALWLLGPDGLSAFEALGTTPPARTAVLLDRSGYSVSRSDWSSRADYVCFDVGEQAAGMRPDAVPNSMHGHADCLSVVICLGGRRVLVDGGLYAYNCDGAWESHFRETAAHNTARIDGRDQARHIGKMAWSHSYRPTIEGWAEENGGCWTIASHDGYARGPEGVTHRRAVWHWPGGCVLILDEFVGAGRHGVELNYQFAPGQLQTTGDRQALFDEFAEMAWAGDMDWTAVVHCGGPGPEDGWICPSLGVREAAPRLTLTGHMAGPRTSLLTILADRSQLAPRILLVPVRSTGRRAIAIAGLDHTDWIEVPGVAETGAISTDATLAVCRMRRSGQLDRFSLAGTYLRIDPTALAGLDLRAAT
ncbi:MAG: heparinase II/III domain-containing protein [Acidobacteriota bacterium]